MGSPFASAALDLHGLGLAPIPLGGADGKVPLVKHKDRQPYSRDTLNKFAASYPSANVGILTGPSRLTVIDIDDPALVDTMLARFGDTPLQVQTPSGGVHLYYRSSGEPSRTLRTEDLAVDIKGLGGMVVAPPSIRPSGPSKGKPYRFVKGDWQELSRLPTLCPDSLSTGSTTKQIRGSHRVPKGKRNNFLFDQLRHEAPHCDDIETLKDVAETIVADRLEHDPNAPFTQDEIDKTVRSVWSMESEDRNWIGQGPNVTFSGQELTILLCNPNALALLAKLRKVHAARLEPFAISPKAMDAGDSIPGWSRKRYQHARDALLEHGFLICVHEGGSGPGDASQYKLSARP
jgi:hypothetical protein